MNSSSSNAINWLLVKSPRSNPTPTTDDREAVRIIQDAAHGSRPSIPVAVVRCAGMALIMAITSAYSHAQSLPEAPTSHSFLSDHTNVALVSGDFTTRTMDAISTRYYEKRNLGHEVGEPAFIAHSYATQLPVSIGIAALNTFAASSLWARGHHKLARTLLYIDIGFDTESVTHNYSLTPKGKGNGQLRAIENTSGHIH